MSAPAVSGSGSGSAAAAPVRPGRPPRGGAPAAGVGVGVALGLVALGAVAVREALVGWGLVGGPSWVAGAATGLDGLGPQAWVPVAGGLAALLGLLLLVLALRPRRRTHLAVGPDDLVWTRPADLARLAHAAAADVPGVTTADVRAGRRRLDVRLTTNPDDGDAVRSRVEHDLAALVAEVRPTPRLTVRSRAEVTS